MAVKHIRVINRRETGGQCRNRQNRKMSSSLDTNTAPVSSSSNSQSSPNNAATDFSMNSNGVLNGTSSSDAAATSNRTDANNTKSFNETADMKSSSASDSERQNGETSGSKKDDSMFECNICLDTAKEAVVSMCGHLFCWPCLHQWLETRPTRQLCPVCKAAISKEKVIPLYGRGSTKEEDPRYVFKFWLFS